MSQAKWLVAAVVPGVERKPLKRLDADEAYPEAPENDRFQVIAEYDADDFVFDPTPLASSAQPISSSCSSPWPRAAAPAEARFLQAGSSTS